MRIAVLALGIIGGLVGALLGMNWIAAVLAPTSLVGSFLLVLGGGLAFLVKPKVAAGAAS